MPPNETIRPEHQQLLPVLGLWLTILARITHPFKPRFGLDGPSLEPPERPVTQEGAGLGEVLPGASGDADSGGSGGDQRAGTGRRVNQPVSRRRSDRAGDSIRCHDAIDGGSVSARPRAMLASGVIGPASHTASPWAGKA